MDFDGDFSVTDNGVLSTGHEQERRRYLLVDEARVRDDRKAGVVDEVRDVHEAMARCR